MRAPVSGTAGAAWRTITMPIRVVAPAVSIAGRALRSEFWIDTQRHRPGTGPTVQMLSRRPDVQRPRDGAGPLNHRTYRVHIAGSQSSPEELIDAFRRDPNRFSPTSFATFDPPLGPEGMRVGDRLTVRLPGPWDGPVVVANAEPTEIRFETLEEHMEAGWIRFVAREHDGDVVFEIESFARSGDPVFDALYHPGKVAKLVQTEMWVRVVEAMVDFSGGQPVGRVIVDTTVYDDPGT